MAGLRLLRQMFKPEGTVVYGDCCTWSKAREFTWISLLELQGSRNKELRDGLLVGYPGEN
jgi:hypothetical protein